ncbi:winged helix-turn-helix domain-containing protein [Gallaecimonas sp. GXIMD4217]|uniref:winged helix-turn-helix domain-containing protein n=1 Tax=Gallaecimonas sp. GXIMD4217 TaxID=3131927 RepID=UPI00311B1A54
MKSGEYQVGAWLVIPAELRLKRNDREETLPPKVFEVLLQMLQAPGHTVSREQLIEQVWQGNEAVGQRGITNAIYQLRKLLADDDQEAIRTIAKTGYQLLLPVRAPAKESEAEPATRKRPWPWGLAVLLVAVALAWAYWLSLAPTVPGYGKARPLTFLEGVEETPALSRDGRYLAFMWERLDEPARIFIQDLQRPDAALRQISFSDDNESNPSWSPDGRRLAFLRMDSTGRCDVYIKDLDDLKESRITSCDQERFHRVLDWSPSGRYLAVIDKVPGQEHTAVFLYDLQSHERRQLTHPSDGERDNQLAWAHGRDELAFVRFQGAMTADLYLVDLKERESRLTKDEASIHGLIWSRDDDQLAFNSMRDGSHNLWLYLLADDSIHSLYRDQTPFNLIALPEPGHYAYVRHAALEYLQGWDGQQQVDIKSSGRDLYGILSPDGERVAFLSNRSGQFELWVARRDGAQARPLTEGEGLMELPAWSADGSQLVSAIVAGKGQAPGLVLFDLAADRRRILLQDGHQYRNPQWNPDGRSLLVASSRSGTWQIWRLDLPSGQLTQLTQQGGQFARQGKDGRLYFTRHHEAGLWVQETDGESRLLIADLAADDWGNWVLTPQGILYVRRDHDMDRLVLWQQDGEVTVERSFDRGSIKINRSLSMDERGRLMLTRLGRREANIMAIAPVTREQ